MNFMDVLGDNGTALGQLILLVATIVGTAAGIWKSGQSSKLALATAEMNARHQMEMIKLQHDNDVADRREKAAQDREDRNLLAIKVADTQASLRQRVDDNADAIRQRMEATALDVRQRVDDNAEHVRVRLNQAEVTVKQEATEVRQRLDKAETTARAEAEAVRQRLEEAQQNRTDQLGTAVEAVNSAGTIAKEALATQTTELQKAIENAMNFTADKADAAYHEANSVNIKIEKLHKAHEAQGAVLQRLLTHLMPLSASGVSRPDATPVKVEVVNTPLTVIPEVAHDPA